MCKRYHNGDRLTQTVNGSLLQSFTYDAHDKLTGGINEGESYDANGNPTVQTLNGQTTRFAWDDEDRLTGQTFPDGHSDTYTYTGLGMRLRKSDPAEERIEGRNRRAGGPRPYGPHTPGPRLDSRAGEVESAPGGGAFLRPA